MRLDARKRACLDAIGIDLWSLKASAPAPAFGEADTAGPVQPDVVPLTAPPVSPPVIDETVSPADPEPRPPALGSVDTLGWEDLQATVTGCRDCDLHQTRTQTVFGVGDRNASLLVVGEAPGADEDRQGEPFVGRAGQLLNAMLEAIGFAREQVYIANIIKCRPPGNRDPHIEETAACQPYLHRQIALIQPRLILAVGRISAHNLLGTEDAVGRLRGRVHRFEPGDIPLIVTYHPAYLLRRPQEKAKAWQDLQAAYRQLHQA